MQKGVSVLASSTEWDSEMRECSRLAEYGQELAYILAECSGISSSTWCDGAR